VISPSPSDLSGGTENREPVFGSADCNHDGQFDFAIHSEIVRTSKFNASAMDNDGSISEHVVFWCGWAARALRYGPGLRAVVF
jgi:hypothetical protein